MLKNVVDYLNYKETGRSNRVKEEQGWSTIQETGRHNVATETEIARHNVAGERLTAQQLEESKRHNDVTESQGWKNLSNQSTLIASQVSSNLASARSSEANAKLTASKQRTEDSLRGSKQLEQRAKASVALKDDAYYAWNNVGAGIASGLSKNIGVMLTKVK